AGSNVKEVAGVGLPPGVVTVKSLASRLVGSTASEKVTVKSFGAVVTISPAPGVALTTEKPRERVPNIRSARNTNPVVRGSNQKRTETTLVRSTPEKADSGIRTPLRTGLRPMLLGGGMNSGLVRSEARYWSLTRVRAVWPLPSVRTMLKSWAPGLRGSTG